MDILIGLALGLIFAAIVFFLSRKNKNNSISDIEQLVEKLRDPFMAVSADALSKSTDQFITVANQTLKTQTELGSKELEGKKGLIDQQLSDMKQKMTEVTDLIKTLEKDRENKFSELSTQLKNSAEQTAKLHDTTNQLQAALSNTKIRGQWGERMAEDVLRLAGFIEGINYLKQKQVDDSRNRPDYTFLLPQNLTVNMDVKFPLNNYLNFLQSEKGEEEKYKSMFLKDVKLRIKEVTSKEYINPEGKTVDYMIVFIPNEQVYTFIQQHDGTIMDEALRNRVVLCSPLTLYAILAIIRQAVDNFRLERAAGEILSLLGQFNNQWNKFQESIDKLGKNITTVQNTYNELSTTRINQLHKPLLKIDEIRRQRGIETTDTLAIDEESEVGSV